jgi:hypothetical protein
VALSVEDGGCAGGETSSEQERESSMSKQTRSIRAEELQQGDLIDYQTKDEQGNPESAEVIEVTTQPHGPGSTPDTKATTVKYYNRTHDIETIHFASDEMVQVRLS